MQADLQVSKILEQTLKNRGKCFGVNSISNCIVSSGENNIVYSYFDTYEVSNKIELELISIKINTESSKVEVLRKKLQFQSYFRVTSREAEHLQILIEANPNNNGRFIVELKMNVRDKETRKSKFFLFECTYQSIINKEPFIMIEIMAHKAINQIHWHPVYSHLFLGLTTESFVIFEGKQNYTEIETIPFKKLEIREKIVDFSFWGNTDSNEKYFLSALGQTGKTYIMFICFEQSQDLLKNNTKFLELYEQDIQQRLKLYQIIDCSKNINWTKIKVIRTSFNKKQIYLILKSSNIEKNNKLQSFLQIYHLTTDGAQNYDQRAITRIDSASNQHEFEFPVGELWDSCFIYYNQNINQLNLYKFLNSLTNPHNKQGKIYPPSAENIDTLLKLERNGVKFILFENKGTVCLRKKEDKYLFQRISPERLELQLGQKVISEKVKKMIEVIKKQINQIPKNDLGFFSSKEFVPLSEQANESQIQRFADQTEKYMQKSKEFIQNEKAALNIIFEQIKKWSHQLETKHSKKEKLSNLLQTIKKNGEKIEQLLKNDTGERTIYDDKIEEIQNMVNFVGSKHVQLDEDARQMFGADIERCLQKAKRLEQMIAQAEKDLNGK